MRYIYKCIRCEKDIEEVQKGLDETLHIEGAICRDCCRKSVNLFYERTLIGMKKLHWTQTAAGKKKMKAARKKQWATRRESAEEASQLGMIADGIPLARKVKPKVKITRPKVDALYDNDVSIRSLLEVLFDWADDMKDAATQIADKLGLEM